jgi:hypothetical protein
VKKILAMLIVMLAGTATFSQTTINFCTAVEKEYCYFNNTQFISPIDSSQALIFMFIKNQNGFNATTLFFNIYSIDKAGKETKIKTLEQACDLDWTWSWKSELFPTPGKYKLKLYNQQQQFINEKSFELLLPK